MSIVKTLKNSFKDKAFTTKEAYEVCHGVNKESVRARIYEKLGVEFDKVARGVYITKEKDCVVIEGDGRKLDFLEDKSIDCIITDHPWADKNQTKVEIEILQHMIHLNIL